MPIHSFNFQGAPGGQPAPPSHPEPLALVGIGPVLQVLVEVARPLAASLRAQGKAVPQPTSGLALIDTGATRSAVDESVIQALGVQPIGVVSIGTAAGVQQQSVYSARFSFPGTTLPAMEFAQLIGVDLRGHVVPHFQAPLIALIGRDILSKFVIVYNGPSASVTLAF